MDWNAGKLCSADAFLYFSADYDRLLRTVICVMATFFSLFTCILLVSDWRLSMEKWSGTNLKPCIFISQLAFKNLVSRYFTLRYIITVFYIESFH